MPDCARRWSADSGPEDRNQNIGGIDQLLVYRALSSFLRVWVTVSRPVLVFYPKAALFAVLAIPVIDRLSRQRHLFRNVDRAAQCQFDQVNSKSDFAHL